MKEKFNLSEKEQEILLSENIYFRGYPTKYVKEFIKRRIERIRLIIKLYPHKHGEELAGEIIEDLLKDAGDKLNGKPIDLSGRS